MIGEPNTSRSIRVPSRTSQIAIVKSFPAVNSLRPSRDQLNAVIGKPWHTQLYERSHSKSHLKMKIKEQAETASLETCDWRYLNKEWFKVLIKGVLSSERVINCCLEILWYCSRWNQDNNSLTTYFHNSFCDQVENVHTTINATHSNQWTPTIEFTAICGALLSIQNTI